MFVSPRISATRQKTSSGLTVVLRFLSVKHNTSTANPPATIQQPTREPNKNEKLIRVAVVGVPNAGKSTFINNLINHRVINVEKAFIMMHLGYTKFRIFKLSDFNVF